MPADAEKNDLWLIVFSDIDCMKVVEAASADRAIRSVNCPDNVTLVLRLSDYAINAIKEWKRPAG